MTKDAVSILHASDLHHHAVPFDDVDKKTQFREVEHQPIQRFWDHILGEDAVPDFAVFSGDLSLQGNPDGLLAAGQHFRELLKRYSSIDPRWAAADHRLIAVPGNHDVTWELEGKLSPDARYEPFRIGIGGYACTPRVPGTPSVHKPYRIDAEKRILIYALDSARLCGVQDEDVDGLASVGKILQENTSESKAVALKWLKGHTVHDVAYVTPQQLRDLKDCVTRECTGEGWIKVVVLHHHLMPLPGGVTVEVKSFELIINAGEVLDALHNCDVSLVLHGHKHVPRIGTHVNVEGHRIVVACAPTAGGQPSQSANGFYWIDIIRDQSAFSFQFATRHHSRSPSYSEKLWLDRPNSRSWASVHAKWLQSGAYSGAAGQRLVNAVANATETTIERLAAASSTRFIGVFPEFMSELVDTVRNATQSLHVACDFPAFGLFSSPDECDELHSTIMSYLGDSRRTVFLRYFDEAAMKAAHRTQFDSGAFLAHVRSTDFAGKLSRLNGRLGKIGVPVLGGDIKVDEFQAALRAVHAQFDRDYLAIATPGKVAKLRFGLPVHLWIIDESQVVFSLPNGLPRTNDPERTHWCDEPGYVSADPIIVNQMLLIWQYYDRVLCATP